MMYKIKTSASNVQFSLFIYFFIYFFFKAA